MSRRYLDLPDWEGLLREIATLTDKEYRYFVTAGDGKPPRIATAIADELFTKWWDDSRFANSRAQFSDQLRTHEGPLKAEISRIVTDALERTHSNDQPYVDELSALSSAVIDGVITTNYDALLESVFRDYKVFVGQNELLFSDTQGIGEIYKIHGDALAPESIVITDRDFSQFNDQNPYLAAKLLTIFVEHPVVFLGYSLSDPDITHILESVARVLTRDGLEQLKDHLVLVEWKPDTPTPSLSNSFISTAGFTIPVRILQVSTFLELFHSLATLQRKFSAPLLRRLKQHVYELVLTNDPQERLVVADIEGAALEDVDVVVGVGMQSKLSELGYRGISRIDLLLDVLKDHSGYNAKRVLEVVLPDLLKQSGTIPIYRYLREAGLLTRDGVLKTSANVDPRVAAKVALGDSPFTAPQSTCIRAQQAADASGSLRKLIDEYGASHAIAYAPALARGTLILDELRDYLMDQKVMFTSNNVTDRANWARLVGLYDFLRFGQQR